MPAILAKKCACKGSFLDKFVQPALLISLSKGECYGFQLVTDLENSGMVAGDHLDPAGLYRTLKRMEEAHLVTSRWDLEGANKPRRIYAITAQGWACLEAWKDTLTEYQNRIGHILAKIPKQRSAAENAMCSGD